MELKVPSQEPPHSPSISETNPNEKEISDDDDDDRNHKHRRRDDARSQSQERDSTEQVYTSKPYKRSNKQFENGHPYREQQASHSNDTYKNYNFNPMDKRRQGPSDLNQRIRGRGNWNQVNSHDPRFTSVDISSRIVPPSVSVPNGLFPGRVSNPYGPYAFGLVPGLDTLYRNINPSMNMPLGLPRQRCRDFEEQGFCLRGDMCPMEHGVNRIVVEDVQSLSQFNLPVSLQNTNLPGPQPGQAPNKPSRGKSTKREQIPNDENIVSDFYDPDQPLWGNDQLKDQVKENGPVMDPGPSSNPSDESKITNTKNKETKTTSNIETIEKQDLLNKRNEINGKNVRKPTQKAQHTLFVSGIPLQQNKRDLLFSHFHKFGEVVDIHIPINSERAFVQFSKREEADAALKAPDAVMGNRFIRLFWANRDNVPINGYNNVPRGTVLNNGTSSVSVPPKAVIVNNPKVGPQKKMESLEVLKEELRKKQEMLDRKRDDFRRKLDKLAKQATAVKGEMEGEQVAKRQKVGNVTDSKNGASSSIVDNGNGNKSMESVVSQTSKSNIVQQLRVGQPVVTNRFKLDNRPTAFKIVSSLPHDLANVEVLKEHFSPFGDLSKVELDDVGTRDETNDEGKAKLTARVYFATRQSAEKAFASGKILNGHNMQFTWIKSSNQSPLKGNPEASASVVEVINSDSKKPEKVEQMETDKQVGEESNKE